MPTHSAGAPRGEAVAARVRAEAAAAGAAHGRNEIAGGLRAARVHLSRFAAAQPLYEVGAERLWHEAQLENDPHYRGVAVRWHPACHGDVRGLASMSSPAV